MGIDKIYEFIEWCADLNIKEVTVYALSLENIKNRGEFEIITLLGLFSRQAINAMKDDRIHRNGIRIKICGDMDYLRSFDDDIGKDVVENLNKLEESTKGYDNMIVNMAIAYGGRQEIINAVRNIVNKGLDLNEENIMMNLWVKSYPDFIIRTAESRLSNFLTWQSAYSEIYFVNKLWQEINKEDLISIINNYRNRERRFGR